MSVKRASWSRCSYIWFDHREEPPWDEVSAAAQRGRVYFYEGDSGSDMHVIVASPVPLTESQVDRYVLHHVSEAEFEFEL